MSRVLRSIHLVSVVLVVTSIEISSAREWTSASGEYKTEAELVAVKGTKVWLLRPDTEMPITVDLSNLSRSDQQYIHDLAKLGRNYNPASLSIPPEVAGFLSVMESLRDGEIARREKRASRLRESIRTARRSGASSAVNELTKELRKQTSRVAELRQATVFVPQISLEGVPDAEYRDDGFPNGLQRGQIGLLDDGFVYQARRPAGASGAENQAAIISGLRMEKAFERPIGALRPGMTTNHESAPYQRFRIEGVPEEFVGESRSRDPNSPLNKLLTTKVFEVDEGDAAEQVAIVLKPYDMTPLNRWLKHPLFPDARNR